MAANALPILLAAGAAFFLLRGKGDESPKPNPDTEDSPFVKETLQSGTYEGPANKYQWWVGELKDGSGWKWIAHKYDDQGVGLDRDDGVLPNRELAVLAARRMLAEWAFVEALDVKLGGGVPEYVSTPVMDSTKENGLGYTWTVGELVDPPGRWRFVVEQWDGMRLLKRADSLELGQTLNIYPSTQEAATEAAVKMVEQWVTEAATP
jgi:hypothetical protein